MDDMEWKLLNPDVYAAIMDFFASNLPILTDEQPSADTGLFVDYVTFNGSGTWRIRLSYVCQFDRKLINFTSYSVFRC